MKVQSSENKLVITEEFIFDQNKLPSDPNNHFNIYFFTIYTFDLTLIFNSHDNWNHRIDR